MLLVWFNNLQPLMRAGGGLGDFWLRRVDGAPLPKRVVKIIKRVAKEEAPKIEYRISPLKEAFQAESYPFKSDYAEIYRQAFEHEMFKIRRLLDDDDDDVLALLL